MTRHIRKYFWLVNLLTIAVCALFAAKAVGRLVEAGLPRPKVKATGGLAGPVRSAFPATPARDVSSILERNVFCSSCEPVREAPAAGPGEDPGGPVDGAPVKTSLNLKLIATLVSEEDKAWSFAAIADMTENATHMFGIGSKLNASAEVTDIMDRRVLMLNSGRNEYLDLGDENEQQPNTGGPTASTMSGELRTPNPLPQWADIAKGIRKVGEGKYEIDRAALNRVLGNTTMLARSARIVPSVRNGKPNGFKLYAIRPGSLYSLIGMFNGDTINAVNGHAMTTPDKALEVYTKLRSASHVSISFNRRGTDVTHEYTIR